MLIMRGSVLFLTYQLYYDRIWKLEKLAWNIEFLKSKKSSPKLFCWAFLSRISRRLPLHMSRCISQPLSEMWMEKIRKSSESSDAGVQNEMPSTLYKVTIYETVFDHLLHFFAHFRPFSFLYCAEKRKRITARTPYRCHRYGRLNQWDIEYGKFSVLNFQILDWRETKKSYYCIYKKKMKHWSYRCS